MAGEAKTADFLLSTATLMIGPQSKVMELVPALHSVGLVKNVQMTTEPNFVTLTQGVQGVEVAAVNISNPARVSAEVYEYTGRNLAYGVGLDASGAAFDPIVGTIALGAAIASGGATVTLAAGGGASFQPGDFVVLQDTVNQDRIHVGKVLSKATDVLTLATGYVMPSTTTFAIATTAVYKVQNINAGTPPQSNVFGAKLVGVLPNDGAPITIIFPKVRITKGLSFSFQNESFSNMPFELQPMALLPTDAYYADFPMSATFKVLTQ